MRTWEHKRRTAISIHAPRAGSDGKSSSVISLNPISIHAPRAGSDHIADAQSVIDGVFQSTLPVRGATAMAAQLDLIFAISIHAPRAGSDAELGVNVNDAQYFNPRSPCGERPAGRPCI